MDDLTLGPFNVGLDLVSPDTTLAPGAVREALNVDFDLSGGLAVRPGRTRNVSETGLHSLWTSRAGAGSFCVRGGWVCAAGIVNDAFATSQLYRLGVDLPVSYDDLIGGVVFTTPRDIGYISPVGVASALGIETPSLPSAVVRNANTAGTPGLTSNPSRYALAASYLAGSEESALSPAFFLDAIAGSTLLVAVPQPSEAKVTAVRIYLTAPNDKILRRAADVPLGTTQWVLGTTRRGRRADNQYLDRMLPGAIARYWNGRLLMARGSTLLISEAMRYGLYNPKHGMLQFPREITMVEPVQDGMFIQSDRLYYVNGSKPDELKLRVTPGQPAIPGASARVSAAELGSLGENLDLRGDQYAIWLARNGFVLGTSEGRIVELQRRHIRLPLEQWARKGFLAISKRRAIGVIT